MKILKLMLFNSKDSVADCIKNKMFNSTEYCLYKSITSKNIQLETKRKQVFNEIGNLPTTPLKKIVNMVTCETWIFID